MDTNTYVTGGVIGFLALLTISLFIANIALLNKFVGSADSWQTIQPSVQTAAALTIAGTVTACIAFGIIAYLYPDYAGIIAVCMSTVAFGVAFGALATAAISRPQ